MRTTALQHFPPAFYELLKALLAEEVEFLLVGGYAVGIHGYPRYTRDIDVWVDIDQINASSVLRVLDDLS